MRNLAKKIELDSIRGSLQHLPDPEEGGPLIQQEFLLLRVYENTKIHEEC